MIEATDDEGFPPQGLRRIHHSEDLETELMVSLHSDRVFVVISQGNKLGSLLSASLEVSGQGNSILVRSLLGRRDDPLLSIYARNIAEETARTTTRPLLLAISLAEEGRSPQIFHEVLDELRSLLRELS